MRTFDSRVLLERLMQRNGGCCHTGQGADGRSQEVAGRRLAVYRRARHGCMAKALVVASEVDELRKCFTVCMGCSAKTADIYDDHDEDDISGSAT